MHPAKFSTYIMTPGNMIQMALNISQILTPHQRKRVMLSFSKAEIDGLRKYLEVSPADHSHSFRPDQLIGEICGIRFTQVERGK